MKTVKTITIPAKVIKREAKTKEVEVITCDICHLDIDTSQDNRYGSGSSKCSLCGRDICRRGVNEKQSWPKSCYDDHPDDHGDYPRKMCKICLPLYEGPMRLLMLKHEKEEEALEAKIKKESLARG